MYRFTAELWLYSGETPWHFLTIPNEIADEIDDLYDEDKRGFGSLPVEVTVGATTWKTSVFPDSSTASYVLPVKKAVRTAEQIVEGDTVTVALRVVTAGR